MKIEKISINGKVFPADSALINATDQSFMYGVGAFETFRIIKGRVFLLEEHFARLKNNLKALDITLDKPDAELKQYLAELLKDLPKDKDAYIRFMVTGGSGALGISGKNFSKPTIVIYLGLIEPLRPIIKKVFILESIKRIKPEYFDQLGFRIKAPDYMSARFARQELAKKSREESKNLDGIMLSSYGYVAEALTANIFWVKDGDIFTPPLNLGILEGTTRRHLLKRHEIREELAGAQQLLEADEIFLTSSVNYIEPVVEINNIKKPGADGKFFKKLNDDLLTDIKKLSVGIN